MRGRPGCPTGQEKNSVEATGGSPPFLQGKVEYQIAPSSAPVCALGHLPPKGKALGVGASLSDYNTHPLPARPAGGRAVTGVGQMGRRPGKKRRRTPAGSPQTRKGGSREEEPLPPWCSFLRLSSKKVGLPRRSRRGKPPGRACPAPVLTEPPTKPPGGNPSGIPVFFKNPCITLPALAQNRCSDDLPRWKDARIHKRMEGFSHETKTVAA